MWLWTGGALAISKGISGIGQRYSDDKHLALPTPIIVGSKLKFCEVQLLQAVTESVLSVKDKYTNTLMDSGR